METENVTGGDGTLSSTPWAKRKKIKHDITLP